MKIKWLDTAITDLAAARNYIAQDNPAAAVRIAKRITQSATLLREHPEIGRSGRVPNTRELVVPDTAYIIPYRVINKNIEILRVLHTARKWPENFS